MRVIINLYCVDEWVYMESINSQKKWSKKERNGTEQEKYKVFTKTSELGNEALLA